jgi:hypothetical protein
MLNEAHAEFALAKRASANKDPLVQTLDLGIAERANK